MAGGWQWAVKGGGQGYKKGTRLSHRCYTPGIPPTGKDQSKSPGAWPSLSGRLQCFLGPRHRDIHVALKHSGAPKAAEPIHDPTARLYAAIVPRGPSWGLSHCCCLDMLPFKRTAFGKRIKQQLSINATRSSTHPSSQHTNATRSWERSGNCRRGPRPTLPSWHMAGFQWSTQEAWLS